ncbi:MAG: DNA-processing protein DprA [Lachnospiraceae bacterium]|nr:DNA-processing protein DprA [Lachnospiraceae bacterium]
MKEQPKNEERAYLYWLNSMDGIGAKTVRRLTDAFDNAKAVYLAGEKQVMSFLTDRQQEVYLRAKKERVPEREYEALVRSGIFFVCADDPDFPEKLRDIPDPPKALYVKGRLPEADAPSVAVVGARFCSSYGRYMARQFGSELTMEGFQVISGMALGIDGIAQTAALEAHGASFAVLGCGVDVCYPPENRALYDRLCREGGVISEYAPGTVPKPHLFPPRNRIISGLSDAVLVVEARKKSGTLITVDMALEQGREVFAVPGRATDRLSDGCNLLLKQGAAMATQASDIAESFFGVRDEADRGKTNAGPGCAGESGKPRMSLSETERGLIEALDIHPRPAADIIDDPDVRASGRTPQELICTLTELALRGLIEQEGNCFARKPA